MIAVSDTGPLRNLSLLGYASLLGTIFDTVAIPRAVYEELTHPKTPKLTFEFMREPPPWLQVFEAEPKPPFWPGLDRGERAAITLAQSLSANVLLTDDKKARAAGSALVDVTVSGTIGVLYLAARLDHVLFSMQDFEDAVTRLVDDPIIKFRSGVKLRSELKHLVTILGTSQ